MLLLLAILLAHAYCPPGTLSPRSRSLVTSL